MCALTLLCGECVAELTLVGEAGGGNRSGGQPLRKQKTKRFCPLCWMHRRWEHRQPQSQILRRASRGSSLLPAHLLSTVISHSSLPPTPPRAPCLHIWFFSWFQFQLLCVVKSDVLPLSDMSCKSTPIESHHFVTVCPVNLIVFVWTSVLWLCSWEPPLAFLMPFSHRPKICSNLWLYRYEYERMVVCLSMSCDRWSV